MPARCELTFLETDVAPSVPPKTRSTILEGVAARSIWRMTLRYLFSARNPNSRNREDLCTDVGEQRLPAKTIA
jgi:hypothetical protein